MSERELYVVALERGGQAPAAPPRRRAEVVEARSPSEAVQAALEGEAWETEDGRYTAHVARLDTLETFPARRSTDVSIVVEDPTPALARR